MSLEAERTVYPVGRSRRGCKVSLGKPNGVSDRDKTLTLEIVSVNGDVHPSTIPGVVDSFTVKRGEVTRVTLTAPKPGVYPIICTKHQPNMQGMLGVLPK